MEQTTDSAHENRPPHMSLSAREMQVLQLIVRGYTNQQIAEEIFISLGTSKAHVRNVLRKLGVKTRTAAAVVSVRMGLLG